jgi:polyisoprenoid-binding protein YceI
MAVPSTTAIPGYRTGRWVVDTVHSEIGFSVRHMMISKVRGRFTQFSATVVTAEDPLASTVAAAVEMASVATGNDQRDADLRSAGFLSVEQHPTMTFVSTGVRSGTDGFRLDGDLTIRGITRPVTFALELGGFSPDPYGYYRMGVSAVGEIKRGDFGITGNMPIQGGGVVIGDAVTINLEIEAVSQDGGEDGPDGAADRD